MFLPTTLLSTAPLASQIASSDGSGSSSSVLLIMALVAIGAIWFITYLISSARTVVVVQNESGSYLGFFILAIAIAILFIIYIAPGSGPI